MFKVDRMDATMIQREDEAMCLPGHILIYLCVSPLQCSRLVRVAHLLPNPKAAVSGSLMAGLSFPSSRKRSGLNNSGSGYIVYSKLDVSRESKKAETDFVVEYCPETRKRMRNA
jgi:hypothetical protein